MPLFMVLNRTNSNLIKAVGISRQKEKMMTIDGHWK